MSGGRSDAFRVYTAVRSAALARMGTMMVSSPICLVTQLQSFRKTRIPIADNRKACKLLARLPPPDHRHALRRTPGFVIAVERV